MYLTDIPQELDQYGFCKTLLVRREVIHIKHIMTEVFTRKSIDIESKLSSIGWNLMEYMEYLTHRLRAIHKIDRAYKSDINNIVKESRSHFFPHHTLYKGWVKKLNHLINLAQKEDFTFFIDNEDKYLEIAWLFGIKTFKYENSKIVNFSLKTK